MGRGQIALINAETRQLHGRRISRSGRFAPPYPRSTLGSRPNQVRGCSRSLKMAPFDRPYATFYWSAIVNIALSCTIFELFDVE